jgi:hypothetical protein
MVVLDGAILRVEETRARKRPDEASALAVCVAETRGRNRGASFASLGEEEMARLIRGGRAASAFL